MKNYIIIALSILVVILYLLKGCNKPIPPKEIVIRTTDTIYKSDTIINYIEKKHTNLSPDTSYKHDRLDLNDTSIFWSTYIYKIKDSLLEATISAYSETRPQIDLSYKLKSFQINDTILIKDSVYKELRIDKNKLYLGSEMVVSPLLSQAYIGASFEHKRGHLFNLDLGYDFNNQQRLIKVGYKRKLKLWKN
jgi:hypothetical protein